MKTKLIYSVVSSIDNYYLEQAFISIYSLKIHNPNAKVALVIDEGTLFVYNQNKTEIKNLIDELIVVKVDQSLSNLQKSRFLKTNLRNYINGDFLFIDSDTIICDKLDEIDTFDFDMGAVKDRHQEIKNNLSKKYIYPTTDYFGIEFSSEDQLYLNSGVIYVKDNNNTKIFYDEWHRQWRKGLSNKISIDQPSFKKASLLHPNVIRELDGEWNCQILDGGLSYLSKAKIIHYYASGKETGDYPYLLKNDRLYEKVRKEGITKDIHTLIIHAKSAFNHKTQIISGDSYEFINSSIYRFTKRIHKKMPFIDKIIEKSYYLLNK